MRNKVNKGFSIVEIIVYTGLLSIFLLLLLNVFVTILNARLESESTSTLNQDARYILSKLFYDIGNADQINTPLDNGDSGSVLVFEKDGITKTYSLDLSGNLVLNDGVTTANLNGIDTEIIDIDFKKLGNTGEGDKPTVKVSMTVKSKIIRQSGDQFLNINTTIGTR